MIDVDPSEHPINQAARACYYADEAIRAVSFNRALKVTDSYYLFMQIAYKESKERLLKGNVSNPYGNYRDETND